VTSDSRRQGAFREPGAGRSGQYRQQVAQAVQNEIALAFQWNRSNGDFKLMKMDITDPIDAVPLATRINIFRGAIAKSRREDKIVDRKFPPLDPHPDSF
jgi:hypothetical protein